jgi:SAM-dependent methyltransferase
MNNDEILAATTATITKRVSAFYESHPYPPPVDDLQAYRRIWDDQRRRAEFHLFWPADPYCEDRSILVAGCGTTQAAHYALRWPRAQVTGIDLSAESIAFTQRLKRKYALANLEVHQLAVERSAELGQRFDQVVCTGVLHHLPDPTRRPRSVTWRRASRRFRRTILLRLSCATHRTSQTRPGWQMRYFIPRIDRIRSRSCWTSSAAQAWRLGAGCARHRTYPGVALWLRRLTNLGCLA